MCSELGMGEGKVRLRGTEPREKEMIDGYEREEIKGLVIF